MNILHHLPTRNQSKFNRSSKFQKKKKKKSKKFLKKKPKKHQKKTNPKQNLSSATVKKLNA